MRIEEYKARIPVVEYIENFVDVDKFEDYCRECKNWEKVWSCPPFKFDPIDYWTQFDRLFVLGYKIFLETEDERANWGKYLADAKNKMMDYLFEMELMYIGGVSLSPGNCKICAEEEGIIIEDDSYCTRVNEEPCRHPEKMRYSIEALGGDVSKTAADLLDLELKWGKNGELPEYFVLVGGLIYSDKAFM